MRVTRKRQFVAVTALVAIITASVLWMVISQPIPTVKLADGTFLHLEGVRFGKWERVEPGGWSRRLKEKVRKLLPESVANRLLKPPLQRQFQSSRAASVVHTNQDALHIYLSRKDPATGDYKGVAIQTGELLDKHGCRFIPVKIGGDYYGFGPPAGSTAGGLVNSSSISWLTFESFPRHEKQFRLRLLGGPGGTVEFTIANPAYSPASADENSAPSLPVSVTKGDMTFILASCSLVANPLSRPGYVNFENPEQIIPEFAYVENGKRSIEWSVLDMELWDGSGNFSPKTYANALFLCPREPVWKLTAKFLPGEKSRSTANTTWTLTNLDVPGPGKFTRINATNLLDGVSIAITALAGSGDLVYWNGIPDPPPAAVSGETQASVGYPRSTGKAISSAMPHLALNIGGMTGEQRLTVWATDEQGRRFHASPFSRISSRSSRAQRTFLMDISTTGPSFLAFDIPPDSKKMDVTFCVHHIRTVEFVFKPPAFGGN